jgi:ferredoxin-NADP reductase
MDESMPSGISYVSLPFAIRTLRFTIVINEANDEDRVARRHDSEGFIDAELLEGMLPERDADYYFCGPKPFMIGIYHNLLKWGIPASQVHFEFFGPRDVLEGAENPPA